MIFLKSLLFIILVQSVCFADSNSENTIGGYTASPHLVQISGDTLSPSPYLNFTGSVTGSTANGVTTVNIGSGSGGGGTPGGSNTHVQYNSSGSFAGNSGFVYNGTNVGIGSTAPGKALDVNGTVRTTTLTVTGSSSFDNGTATSNGSGAFTFTGVNDSALGTTSGSMVCIDGSSNLTTSGCSSASQWTTTNTNDVYLPNSGNVGIGTNFTRTAALTVMNGNVGIGTYAPSNIFQIEGSSNPTFAISSTGNFSFNNSTGSGNTLTINGASLTSGRNILSNCTSSGLSNDCVEFNNSSASNTVPVVKILQNGSGPALAVATGNVGIGTITPQATLDVWGTASLTHALLVNSAGNVGIGTTNPQGALTIISGNVGIGTWVPGNLFQVGTGSNAHGFQVNGNGNISAIGDTISASISATTINLVSSASQASIINNSSTNGSGFRVVGSGATNGNVELRTTSGTGSGDFIKFTGGTNGGTEIARMLGNGNVGIGSTNPGQALDVQGTIRALSGGTCTTLYSCNGGVDVGVIQTSACSLCPGGTCMALQGCF